MASNQLWKMTVSATELIQAKRKPAPSAPAQRNVRSIAAANLKIPVHGRVGQLATEGLPIGPPLEEL